MHYRNISILQPKKFISIRIGYLKLIRIAKVQRLSAVKPSWTKLLLLFKMLRGLLNSPGRKGKL